MSAFQIFKSRSFFVGPLVLFCQLGLFSKPADAGIVIVAPDITLSSSNSVQSGSFEVFANVTGGDLSDLIGGTQIDLKSTVQSNVTFTSVTITGASPHPYIFGQSATPGTITNANEAYLTDVPPGSDPLLTNSVGLMRVNYQVAANFVGSIPLTFNTDDPNVDPFGTFIQDNHVNNLAFTVVNGSISVSAVPEPSSVVLLGLGMLGIIGFHLKRRRQLLRSAK